MAPQSRTDRPLKSRGRGMFRTQYACCGHTWHDRRLANAHHLAAHGRYWTSDKARKIGRKIGKDADRIRRIGRAGWEAFGLRDSRGALTAKGRSRPSGPVRNTRDLQDRHRHGRDSDRADERAARYENRAGRADARADRHAERAARAKNAGRTGRAARADARATAHRDRAAAHRDRVADTRMDFHQRWPERTSR